MMILGNGDHDLRKQPKLCKALTEVAVEEKWLDKSETLCPQNGIAYCRYVRSIIDDLPPIWLTSHYPNNPHFWETNRKFNQKYQEFCQARIQLNGWNTDMWKIALMETEKLGDIYKNLEEATNDKNRYIDFSILIDKRVSLYRAFNLMPANDKSLPPPVPLEYFSEIR